MSPGRHTAAAMISPRLRGNGILAFILVLAALLYLPALHAPPMLDDLAGIHHAAGLRGRFGWLGPDAFGLFRPVKNLFFLFFTRYLPDAVWAWHTVSFLLHAAAATLAARYLRHLTGSALIAGVTVAAWVLAPTQVSGVAWASCVNIQAMAAAGFFALLSYERSHNRHNRRDLAGFAAGLAIAVLSYEPAIAIAPLVLISDLLLHPQRLHRRRTWLGYLLMASICVGCLAAGRWHGSGEATRNDQIVPMTGAALSLHSAFFLVEHLAWWIWPFGRQAMLATFDAGAPGMGIRLGVAWTILASVIILILCIRRRAPLPAFGLAGFLVSFLPMSNLVPLFSGPIADYYLVFPSLGLALVFGWGVARLSNTPRRAARLGLMALVLWRVTAAAALPGWAANWRSERALLAQSLRARPDAFAVQANLARVEAASGALARAEALARAATERAPWLAQGHYALADVFQRTRRDAQAADVYRHLAGAHPRDPVPLVLLGVLQETRLARTDDALASYRAALARPWNTPYSRIAAINLAGEHTLAGRTDKALGILRAALVRAPREGELHQSLAVTLYRAGDPAAAQEHAGTAAALGTPLSPRVAARIREAARFSIAADPPSR